MRHAAPLLAILSIMTVAVRAAAQTPDVPTPTQTVDTPTAIITPTATATPLSARPDEIIFTGAVPLPAGATIRALFRDISSTVPVECGSTEAMPPGPTKGLSSFVLTIEASCAEGRIGPRLCWSDSGCYIYLADRRECTPWDGCAWSDVVAPGNVVDLGFVPVAADDEVVFIGEVPAPKWTTVTVQVIDIETLQISTCDSTTSVDTGANARSTFVLRVAADCMPIGLPPKFCWGTGRCDFYTEQTIIENSVAAGVTINVGLLRDRSGLLRPLPLPVHGDSGPATLPRTGQGQAINESLPSWLAALVALGIILPLVGQAARRKG